MEFFIVRVLCSAITLVAATATSYAMAKLHEPQAYWLWHIILGVL